MIFCILDFFLRRAWRAQVDIFIAGVGYRPNIAWPRRYHEKMLWRRIFDHDPQFTLFSDKLAAKEYIRQHLPELKIPETLWAGTSLADAPREWAGPEVVIKTNHGSSFNYFPAREHLPWAEVCARFADWLRAPYGQDRMEWGYLDVERQVFIEQLVPVAEGRQLLDIAIECTDGVAAYGYITINQKMENKKLNNYAVNGEELTLFGGYIDAQYRLPKTLNVHANFLQAVAFAERLSQGFDYLRVDFLGNGEDLYGGEITVYPMGGISRATPAGMEGGDTLVNRQWDIRKSWFLSTQQQGWRKYYAWALNRALRAEGGS